MKKVIIALSLIATLVISVYLGLEHHKEQQFLASPEYALSRIESAIQEQDFNTVNKHTDISKLADTLLVQILKDTPQEENGTFLNMLSNSINKKFADYIQPELKRNLESQIQTFIEGGEYTQKIDITRLYSDRPLLEKIWFDFTGPEGIQFLGFSDITTVSESKATAVATFHRKDLDYKAPVELILKKQHDTWVISHFKNLDTILVRIQDLTAKIKAEKQRKVQQQIDQTIRIPYTTKSSAMGEFGIGANIMLGVAFENISQENIEFVRAKVTFKHLDKSILRQVDIKDSDMIASGDIVEKSWPMPLNPLSSDDAYIFSAEESSMTIETAIYELHLENGTKLIIDPKE